MRTLGPELCPVGPGVARLDEPVQLVAPTVPCRRSSAMRNREKEGRARILADEVGRVRVQTEEVGRPAHDLDLVGRELGQSVAEERLDGGGVGALVYRILV